jgi:hypothetical protein
VASTCFVGERVLQFCCFRRTFVGPIVAEQALGTHDLEYGTFFFLVDQHTAWVHRRIGMLPGRRTAIDGQPVVAVGTLCGHTMFSFRLFSAIEAYHV